MENENGFELEMDVIEIETEDGTVEECGVQGEFKSNNRSYMALSPIGEDNFLKDDIVYFFRVDYEDEDLVLEDIEDEEELANVKKAYADFTNPAIDKSGFHN